MSNQPSPVVTKLDVLEKASAASYENGKFLGDSMISSTGNVAVHVSAMKGDFEGRLSDKVEYLYCVRGSVHYTELKNGDQEVPPFDLNAGELITFPPGWLSKGTCSARQLWRRWPGSKPRFQEATRYPSHALCRAVGLSVGM